MSEAELRGAILGCGAIGCGFADSHAAAYHALAQTRLVAVADIDAQQARRCAARYPGARSYSDPRLLLRAEKPDLVSVCTPDDSHPELVAAALEANGVRGVLAEKPLATNATDARRLVELAARRGVTLAVNYLRRYAPGIAEVRRLLASGRLGEPRVLSGLYTKGLLHNGTHALDLIRYLWGELEVIGASAEDPSRASRIDVVLRSRQGARAVLLGLEEDAFTIFELDIIMSAGRLRLLDGGERIEVWIPGPHPAYRGLAGLRLDRQFGGDIALAIRHAVSDLARCVESGERPLCSGADGLAAVVLAEEALRHAGVAAATSVPASRTRGRPLPGSGRS